MKKAELERLVSLYHEHRLGHAFLIETNNVESCYLDLKETIKEIICPNTYSEKCTNCNLCHLIDIDSMPSLITVSPDGKSIKKDAIESLKQAFVSMPIYTNENIYVIKYAETMNDTAYNKILKFLEEPEANIIGFFLTNNKDDMPSTIVSRCETLKVNYNEDIKANDEIRTIVIDYIEKMSGNEDVLWYNKGVSEKLTERSDLILFFKYLFDYYHENITKYVKEVKIVEKYLDELNYNVNASLLLDSFAIEMRNIYEK